MKASFKDQTITATPGEWEAFIYKLRSYTDNWGDREKAIWAGLDQCGFLLFKEKVPLKVTEYLEFLQISLEAVPEFVKRVELAINVCSDKDEIIMKITKGDK